jgi:hypothetical protein
VVRSPPTVNEARRPEVRPSPGSLPAHGLTLAAKTRSFKAVLFSGGQSALRGAGSSRRVSGGIEPIFAWDSVFSRHDRSPLSECLSFCSSRFDRRASSPANPGNFETSRAQTGPTGNRGSRTMPLSTASNRAATLSITVTMASGLVGAIRTAQEPPNPENRDAPGRSWFQEREFHCQGPERSS